MLLRKNNQNVTKTSSFLKSQFYEVQAAKFCVFLTDRLYFINVGKLVLMNACEKAHT